MHYNMSDKVYQQLRAANYPTRNFSNHPEPMRKQRTKMSDDVKRTNDRRLYEPYVY